MTSYDASLMQVAGTLPYAASYTVNAIEYLPCKYDNLPVKDTCLEREVI